MGHFDTGKEINAKKFNIYIGSASNEWKLVQNARVLVSHPVFREPTTSGGVITYTGAADHTISGTLLFTTDEWTTSNSDSPSAATGVAGLAALLTPDATSGEVRSKTWLVKFTDMNSSSTTTTLTFANCKLSVADISKSVEGAIKVDITIVCPDEPT